MHLGVENQRGPYWVAVETLKLDYYNWETPLFTIYPYYGKLVYVP